MITSGSLSTVSNENESFKIKALTSAMFVWDITNVNQLSHEKSGLSAIWIGMAFATLMLFRRNLLYGWRCHTIRNVNNFCHTSWTVSQTKHAC